MQNKMKQYSIIKCKYNDYDMIKCNVIILFQENNIMVWSGEIESYNWFDQKGHVSKIKNTKIII